VCCCICTRQRTFLGSQVCLFAECYGTHTRQTGYLPSVTRQSVHIQLFFCFFHSNQSNKIYVTYITVYNTNITIYHTNITYMSHKPQVHHQSTYHATTSSSSSSSRSSTTSS
jgi:hypothetical protein